jgi:hypothetical protein
VPPNTNSTNSSQAPRAAGLLGRARAGQRNLLRLRRRTDFLCCVPNYSQSSRGKLFQGPYRGRAAAPHQAADRWWRRSSGFGTFRFPLPRLSLQRRLWRPPRDQPLQSVSVGLPLGAAPPSLASSQGWSASISNNPVSILVARRENFMLIPRQIGRARSGAGAAIADQSRQSLLVADHSAGTPKETEITSTRSVHLARCFLRLVDLQNPRLTWPL